MNASGKELKRRAEVRLWTPSLEDQPALVASAGPDGYGGPKIPSAAAPVTQVTGADWEFGNRSAFPRLFGLQ